MTESLAKPSATTLVAVVAFCGFVAVGFANASNMVLARANAGETPAFSLAFFRWSIVALGLAPFAFREIRLKWAAVRARYRMVVAAGACGMFLMGGPIYMAGVTTTAINIGLIMAATPIMVLVISWQLGLERIGWIHIVSIVLALSGVAIILAQGSLDALAAVRFTPGDIIVILAMLSWSAYNLIQVRALPDASFLARTCLYAGVGALMSFPFFAYEAIAAPELVFSLRACAFYLFAGLIPGIGAYAGFAYLSAAFGSVRASLMMYVSPIAAVVLSILFLGEGPALYHLLGGLLVLAGVWLTVRK
jgi:drug/metabolite transporter (DMT)-like permease